MHSDSSADEETFHGKALPLLHGASARAGGTEFNSSVLSCVPCGSGVPKDTHACMHEASFREVAALEIPCASIATTCLASKVADLAPLQSLLEHEVMS